MVILLMYFCLFYVWFIIWIILKTLDTCMKVLPLMLDIRTQTDLGFVVSFSSDEMLDELSSFESI